MSGFSIDADATGMATAAVAARQAWDDAGRAEAPRVVTGCFYTLGVDEPQETLRGFTYDYLRIFGQEFARAMADDAPVWNGDRLLRALDDAEAAGVDEFILVPGTVDPPLPRRHRRAPHQPLTARPQPFCPADVTC